MSGNSTVLFSALLDVRVDTKATSSKELEIISCKAMHLKALSIEIQDVISPVRMLRSVGVTKSILVFFSLASIGSSCQSPE